MNIQAEAFKQKHLYFEDNLNLVNLFISTFTLYIFTEI